MRILIAVTMVLLATIGAIADDVEISVGEGRHMIVHLPPDNAPKAVLAVLHGGGGNPDQIRGALEGLDALADQKGIAVAYLAGLPATRRGNSNVLAWNAGGGCCGQPAAKAVDDVGYVLAAIDLLKQQYSLPAEAMFALGHSNGAMLLQRIECERGLFRAVVVVAGPLNLDVASCPAAAGTTLYAIHGALDRSVPIGGGVGEGITNVSFRSQAEIKAIYDAAGAHYDLDIVPGAAHRLATIDEALLRRDGQGLAATALARLGF